MSLTLADYRARIRDKLGDTDYSTTSIDTAINDYIYELYSKFRTRRMEDSDELIISSGDTSVEFPDTMQTLLNLVVTSPSARPIMKMYSPYGTFMENYPDFQTATPSQVNVWTDFAEGMRLAAPADVETVVLCDFLREPVAMVDATDEADIKDRYAELVTIGGLARAMEINEDYAEAGQERDKLEPLEAIFNRNEGRGQIKVGPNVIRSNRSRGTYRADRDF